MELVEFMLPLAPKFACDGGDAQPVLLALPKPLLCVDKSQCWWLIEFWMFEIFDDVDNDDDDGDADDERYDARPSTQASNDDDVE